MYRLPRFETGKEPITSSATLSSGAPALYVFIGAFEAERDTLRDGQRLHDLRDAQRLQDLRDALRSHLLYQP